MRKIHLKACLWFSETLSRRLEMCLIVSRAILHNLVTHSKHVRVGDKMNSSLR